MFKKEVVKLKENLMFIILIYNGLYLKLYIKLFWNKKCLLVINCIVIDNVKDINKSYVVIFIYMFLFGKLLYKVFN